MLDLAASSVSRDDARATASELFRRLLRRDATNEELAEIAQLADGTNARDFAVAACFAIGTTSEAVLY
jgi:hypothetical protein